MKIHKKLNDMCVGDYITISQYDPTQGFIEFESIITDIDDNYIYGGSLKFFKKSAKSKSCNETIMDVYNYSDDPKVILNYEDLCKFLNG
jgi:hypothetical protein